MYKYQKEDIYTSDLALTFQLPAIIGWRAFNSVVVLLWPLNDTFCLTNKCRSVGSDIKNTCIQIIPKYRLAYLPVKVQRHWWWQGRLWRLSSWWRMFCSVLTIKFTIYNRCSLLIVR